jgi:hypothetical protein
MNNFRKQAALAKYAPALQNQPIEEIEAMVKADDKAYADDEVKEIMEALKPVDGETPPKPITELKEGENGGLEVKVTNLPNADGLDKALKSFGSQKTYEECKITVTYDADSKPVINKGAAIRKVRIEPEVAEQMNRQALNSKLHYYEVE